jgi:hypothetical protein
MTSIVDSPDPAPAERLSEQARFVHGSSADIACT